jgi:hypothetical protein
MKTAMFLEMDDFYLSNSTNKSIANFRETISLKQTKLQSVG